MTTKSTRFLVDDKGVYDLAAVSAITKASDGTTVLHVEGGQVIDIDLPFNGVIAVWQNFLTDDYADEPASPDTPTE